MQRTSLSTTFVAECLSQQGSGKHDKRKSSGAAAWAVWEPVLRKDMEAEGAQTEYPCAGWIDTDKGDAGPPNYRSRLVVRKIMKTTMKSDVPSAAELFSEMPPLEMVKELLSLCSSLMVKKRRKASEPWQCTTSSVRISMEHWCEDGLWNSQVRKKIDLLSKDTTLNTLSF